MTTRSSERIRAALVGEPPEPLLVATHAIHAMAETFLTVSLAGSLFFSTSPDASRPGVLLYLVVTIAPMLILAPLIGPIIDRAGRASGTVLVATFPARFGLGLALAANLQTALLYPVAFSWLVTSKSYTIARNALLPQITAQEDRLVAANARLSRTATLVTGASAAIAVGLYQATSARALVLMAAGIALTGTIPALRTRDAASRHEPQSSDQLVDLADRDVGAAFWDMAALRAATGFAIFHFGFALRTENEPTWLFGAVIAAHGLGAFVGLVVAPSLRRRMAERHLLTAAISAAATATVLSGAAFNDASLIVAMATLGLSSSVGRRAFDATLQRAITTGRRGQVYAELETRLELAWVVAASTAVAIRVATWVGAIGLAAFLFVAMVVHYRRHQLLASLRRHDAPVADRLLQRARALAEHGYHDEAVIVAHAAHGDPTTPPADPGVLERAHTGSAVTLREATHFIRETEHRLATEPDRRTEPPSPSATAGQHSEISADATGGTRREP